MASLNVGDWLRSGDPWEAVPPRAIETHAAIVFLVGELAYKMKKPVDLGYLDFSSLAKRHAALARELELNRRTAPATYLRLVSVVERHGQLALGGEGHIVEWLLEMQRFPDGSLLSEVADRGTLSESMVEQLAAHAASFHDAATVISGYDWPAAVARIARENASDLESQAHVFDALSLAASQKAREQAHKRCALALDRQSLDVRRCHGDMHLANAFLDHGTPTLFDCIEFDDFYATIPPLYDIAFLLMDLIARGLHRHANRALSEWAMHRAPDTWPSVMASLATLPLCLLLRAEIRAKTEARRPGGQARAQHYLTLARTLADRGVPKLIAIGGLSGTGKSSLAKAIAWRIGGGAGAIHLRTDVVRKRLAGVAMEQRLPESAYAQAASSRIYSELAALVPGALNAGASVVVDAVFARESERIAVEKIARESGVSFTGIWLEAPAAVLEQRVGQRLGDASDADVEVVRRQLSYDLGNIAWIRVDASRSAEDIEHDVLARIGPSLTQVKGCSVGLA